jgi:hypothetical protein
MVSSIKKVAHLNAECGIRLPAGRQGMWNSKLKTAWSKGQSVKIKVQNGELKAQGE